MEFPTTLKPHFQMTRYSEADKSI